MVTRKPEGTTPGRTGPDPDHLKDLRRILKDAKWRMENECESDQNYVQLGKLVLDVWRQINEISGHQTSSGGIRLSEFEKRLQERRAGG